MDEEHVSEKVHEVARDLDWSFEEEKLLRVIRENIRAIRWSLDDIKGISPIICMYKILIEAGHKTSTQPQRRLNPAMQEVVKKEVIKLLDAAPKDQNKTTFTCPYGTFAYKWMLFGLCNGPVSFQQFMMEIFHDIVENFIEVFMDDFSVVGSSFDECLCNLKNVLHRCEESNLVLNWDKCHFMVKEGIVFGHKVSEIGVKVDWAKLKVIEKLPPPMNLKGIRSFLGHAGFYRRFIKDFSSIAKPLTNLMIKEWHHVGSRAWTKKGQNTSCDVLCQSYLVGSKVIVHTDHSALKYLMSKKDDKTRKGSKNQVANHLSCLENQGTGTQVIHDDFPEQLFEVTNLPWYADIVNYLSNGIIRRSIPAEEVSSILSYCHTGPIGSNFGAGRTAAKVLQSEYYWLLLFKDAYANVIACDSCQKVGNKYILVAVDYVSKWVEALSFRTNEFRVTGEESLLQLNEHEELRLDAYENAEIYKEKNQEMT
ncbi:uncharacterized protein [Henckelia pumila]|uniref:uncharacterized protein n=1 Tax=Henckelia pumila TaxID=405737 RepID=UPI003C6E827E